jgi:hypothetical protein
MGPRSSQEGSCELQIKGAAKRVPDRNSDQPFIDMHAGQRQHRGHDADDHEWRQQHDQRAAAREYAGTVDVRQCPRRPQTEMRPPVGISTKWINSWMMTAAAATPVAAKNPAKPFMGDPNGTVWPSAIDQPMQTSTVATAPQPKATSHRLRSRPVGGAPILILVMMVVPRVSQAGQNSLICQMPPAPRVAFAMLSSILPATYPPNIAKEGWAGLRAAAEKRIVPSVLASLLVEGAISDTTDR